MTLLEMLRWTYSVQCADTMSGKLVYTHGDTETHYGSGDGVVSIREGDGRPKFHSQAPDTRMWTPQNDLHRDAEMVHNCVLDLAPLDAALVIKFGYNGVVPEVEIPRPRPAPPEAQIETIVAQGEENMIQRGDRMRRGVFEGEAVLYRVAVSEVLQWREWFYASSGKRGKKLRSHSQRVRYEVEYCPLIWWPSGTEIEAASGRVEHWKWILETLAKDLADIVFSEHEITDLPAP